MLNKIIEDIAKFRISDDGAQFVSEVKILNWIESKK